jgi:hypothetical protein
MSKIFFVTTASVADPHHVDVDPDLTYHFDADPDFYSIRIQIQLPNIGSEP